MDEMMLIPPDAKRRRSNETDTEENNKDRFSDLPDCILLHILSFIRIKYAVRTCILSTRWKDLWKSLPILTIHPGDFHTSLRLTKFMSKLLTLRDGSTALQEVDLAHCGRSVHPRLLNRIVQYATSHNAQQLALSVICGGIEHIQLSIFSCETLTSLKLAIELGKGNLNEKILPLKSLNLPALTTLHLRSFAFCGNGNGNDRAEPFSSFKKLTSLTIDSCRLKDAHILCISNTTLCNLTMHNIIVYAYKFELCSPSLRTFAFKGDDVACETLGRNLSSIEHVNFDIEKCPEIPNPSLVLLNWLEELANIKSLTVSTRTLQVLSLNPDLLELKYGMLGSLKSLKVIRDPPHRLVEMLREPKYQKPTARSHNAAVGLRRTIKKVMSIPEGIVEFLLQNSPTAKVDIINCSTHVDTL